MRLEQVLNKNNLNRDDLIYLMGLKDEDKLEKLYNRAYEIKSETVGQKVYFRGLIEFSNRCIKNCNYCGIRHDNNKVNRYTMNEEEILESANWVYENNYGSIVLQSGERNDEEYIEFVNKLVKKIKELSNGELGITLSLGEQTKETYQKWFDLGAHRYLLRIETSNEELYKSIHPNDHDFQSRKECIAELREIGYQVGTGVMIGLPGQTREDLVDDILFFKDESIDMIGMGPYVIHEDTPLVQEVTDQAELRTRNFTWSLKMVAILRLAMPDINIAATTALQALNPIGRELALQAGANILMPIVTHPNYREDYQLYENKPCIDEKPSDCKDCLANRVKNVGDEIIYGAWGDSPHYFKRIKGRESDLGSQIDIDNAAGK
ncbi:[FeFe] hydrogenase H-cluster radical SAM maturase HydE [Acetohalobium arabaticum]|uniref:Radical SAM domain protein n=1 Tax=Acetohalobium arabaticum (strain ATCC 49924 / DSM 5501 / Z-7288) TaxID=574087 RepID=D9QT32_ACEAZ|nr:[FeFe] hydrogenase H-cluster radical SAM maturase HydE [Acetohalobium arabaticum]ADL13532.1 Radical SAM domain protein [Acetohalobium arabaticum DSM 5501]